MKWPFAKSKIARLVSALSSKRESEAKSAAVALEDLLFPNYGPGPRLVTPAEAQRISENHFATIRSSDAIQALMAGAVEGTEFARAFATGVLGHIGDRRALPLLLGALSDPAPAVRAAAVKSLGFFQEPSSVAPMVQLLDDPAPEVRSSAAAALGFVRSPDAVPALMAFYERGNWQSKVEALTALAYICDPRSLPLARAALSDRARRVRDAAKFALGQYDWNRRQGN
jgi:HEAT repeat protein